MEPEQKDPQTPAPTPETQMPPVEPAAPVTPEATPATEASLPSPMQPSLLQSGVARALLAVAVLALGVGGYVYYTQNANDADSNTPENVLSLAGEGDGPVARVNGTDISRDDFNRSAGEMTQTATLQGADVNDLAVQAEIKDQALTALINTELLLQNAKNSGVSVTAETVTTEYEGIVSRFGGEEALNAQLASLSLSKEDLQRDLEKQLLISAYVEKNVNLASFTVTDAEVQEFYDSLTGSGTELPPLEEVSAQIKTQIQSQKQQAAVSAFIEGLKANASIEVLI